MLRSFALRHGVGYGTLQRARDGKTKTQLDTLAKIAKAFRIDVAQLLIPGEGERIVSSRKQREPRAENRDDSRELQRGPDLSSSERTTGPTPRIK